MDNYTENEKDEEDSLKDDVEFNLNRLNKVAKNLNKRIYETNHHVEDLEKDITKRLNTLENTVLNRSAKLNILDKIIKLSIVLYGTIISIIILALLILILNYV